MYNANGVEMKYGRFFTDIENRRRAPVAVLGEDVAGTLFPDSNPEGKWVEVAGKNLEVIGVMNRIRRIEL